MARQRKGGDPAAQRFQANLKVLRAKKPDAAAPEAELPDEAESPIRKRPAQNRRP